MSDSDINDTRTILPPILRHTYDSDGYIRVTRTSLSYVYHHLKFGQCRSLWQDQHFGTIYSLLLETQTLIQRQHLRH